MRTIKHFLVCLCLSSLFAFTAYLGSAYLRTVCIACGARWSFLASMGGIMVFVSVGVLIGAAAGAMVGKKLCCRGHKLSTSGGISGVLCGGLGGLAAAALSQTYGIGEGRRERLLIVFIFFVVIPLFAVLGYEVVSKIQGNKPRTAAN